MFPQKAKEESNFLDSPSDVLIIGGSHAGLSAALTLYRALHSCIIFDSGTPRNALSTPTHLTSSWENEDPQKLREKSKAELVESGLVQFVSTTVKSAKKNLDGTFEVIDEKNVTWRGRKLLFASGVLETHPDIEGYTENYGKLIYYCMFCFGYEHRRSREAGVLAEGILTNPIHAITNAQDAHKFAETITIYTHGNPSLAVAISEQLDEGMQVDDRKVVRLHKTSESDKLGIVFEDGTQKETTFLVHKPDLYADQRLTDQLGVECVPNLGIKITPPFNQTSISGVYAAGDCCSPLRMIPNAMTMGSFAGCGISRELSSSINSSRALARK